MPTHIQKNIHAILEEIARLNYVRCYVMADCDGQMVIEFPPDVGAYTYIESIEEGIEVLRTHILWNQRPIGFGTGESMMGGI